MPKIYVIIVTYNAMKWAEKCLSSLRKSSVAVQTIVVDNGSNDGTQDFIKTNFPEVEFVQSAENLGFGKANNLGIEIAYKNGADFFYLMNQDAWLFEDSLEKMLIVYENYPKKEEIGIISPMHLDGTEKKLDVFFERYLARNTHDNRLISDIFCNNIQDFYLVNFVNAAHWLIPKATIEKVGGFNSYFFHYSEDYEYVQRIIFHQKQILICAKSKVVHDGKQSFSKTEHIDSEKVQAEQKYLNPNTAYSKKMIFKDYLPSILYNLVLLKLQNFNKFTKYLIFHIKNDKKIVNHRNIILNNTNPFLILRK